MRPVFDDKTLQDKLMASLKSWNGTPYRHYTLMKGRAVDCFLFIGEVLKEVGLIKDYYRERLSKDWALHMKEEMLVEFWLKQEPYFKPNIITIEETDDPLFGDIVFFGTIKDCPCNHVGIYTGRDRIWHVNMATGVCETRYGTIRRAFTRKIGRIWSGSPLLP